MQLQLQRQQQIPSGDDNKKAKSDSNYSCNYNDS
jgi:hypothetical protein